MPQPGCFPWEPLGRDCSLSGFFPLLANRLGRSKTFNSVSLYWRCLGPSRPPGRSSTLLGHGASSDRLSRGVSPRIMSSHSQPAAWDGLNIHSRMAAGAQSIGDFLTGVYGSCMLSVSSKSLVVGQSSGIVS